MSTVYHTLHTQVTRTEDIRRRRRVTQQVSNVRVLADKSFLQGEGILQPTQSANMFGSAEVLFLNSDQPVTVQLLDPTDDTVLSTVPNTRSYAFDVTDTGGSFKVIVENASFSEPATVSWFAFDNFTTGSLTGGSSVLQQQVNANIAAIAQLQADLAALQADVSTNSAAIANLQTTLTALQAQLTALDTTVQSNVTRLDAVEAAIAALQSDVAALQLAVLSNATDIANNTGNVTANAAEIDALQTAVLSNDSAIAGATADLLSLTTAVTDNDNDILSLQQLMATVTQSVSENTADILKLLDGGWPISFGKTLEENARLATFIVPYDMEIPAQDLFTPIAQVAPVGGLACIEIYHGEEYIGYCDWQDGSLSGNLYINEAVQLAKGEYLSFRSLDLFGIEAPSFTFNVTRILDMAPVAAVTRTIVPIVSTYAARDSQPNVAGHFVSDLFENYTLDPNVTSFTADETYTFEEAGTQSPNSYAGEANAGPLHARDPFEAAVIGLVWYPTGAYSIEPVVLPVPILDLNGLPLSNADIMGENSILPADFIAEADGEGNILSLRQVATVIGGGGGGGEGPAPGTQDYNGNNVDGGSGETPVIPHVVFEENGTGTEPNWNDLGVSDTRLFQFPGGVPLQSDFESQAIGPVRVRSDQDPPFAPLGTLYEDDGVTAVNWNDPRIVNGGIYELVLISGSGDLQFFGVPGGK